jgi:hypothetical protein
VGERLGQRRLAITAGAAQRRGDGGYRVAFGVDEPAFQRVEFAGR